MVLTSLPIRIQANEPVLETSVESTAPNFFSDVNDSDWFYESAFYVWSNGLFQGIGEHEFSPQGSMTRAMFITVLGRMAEIDTASFTEISLFRDVEANQWYTPYVQWATKLGSPQELGMTNLIPKD
jgi:hypothetical protein